MDRKSLRQSAACLREGGDAALARDIDLDGLDVPGEDALHLGAADHSLHLVAPSTPLLIEEEHPGALPRRRCGSP